MGYAATRRICGYITLNTYTFVACKTISIGSSRPWKVYAYTMCMRTVLVSD